MYKFISQGFIKHFRQRSLIESTHLRQFNAIKYRVPLSSSDHVLLERLLFVAGEKFSPRLDGAKPEGLERQASPVRLIVANQRQVTGRNRPPSSPGFLFGSVMEPEFNERMAVRWRRGKEGGERSSEAAFNRNQREHDPRFRDPERALSRQRVDGGSRGGQVKKNRAAPRDAGAWQQKRSRGRNGMERNASGV